MTPLWWILAWLAGVAYADSRTQAGPTTLDELLQQLDDTSGCNRTMSSPLVQRLLNGSLDDLERTETTILWLANLVSKHSYLIGKSMPLNASMTTQPLAVPVGKQPALALHLLCHQDRTAVAWTGFAVYATSVANTFLQVQLPHLLLNACHFSQCSAKCVASTHGSIRVFASTCCGDETKLCRSGHPVLRLVFLVITAVFLALCVVMIPATLRERKRQQQEARGWALMELFFIGAILIYSVPLVEVCFTWCTKCWLSVWLREVGFTLFYGSVILKIFRNLQEYRVRKAHHVFVREQDLMKYLAFLVALTITGLVAWTVGSAHNSMLWESYWPRCSFEIWSWFWPLYELTFLLYGLRLCYKAYRSTWVERYQFSWAVFSEAFFGTVFNLWRYYSMDSWDEDLALIVAVLQLHVTLSVNMLAILIPKIAFATGDSNRRTLTMTGAAGSSGRAHPSLAKLRDNLINGTIDFAEIPIVDMNPEDIRAELKRVYTQLRMYKLKNLYQDNPHISKRKGGKKTSDKNAKNRRISIPPTSSSPKARRLDEEEEKSDLTVESAPHNVYLSTQKIQLESADQSVRV